MAETDALLGAASAKMSFMAIPNQLKLLLCPCWQLSDRSSSTVYMSIQLLMVHITWGLVVFMVCEGGTSVDAMYLVVSTITTVVRNVSDAINSA